jgi:hypothetical protein
METIEYANKAETTEYADNAAEILLGQAKIINTLGRSYNSAVKQDSLKRAADEIGQYPNTIDGIQKTREAIRRIGKEKDYKDNDISRAMGLITDALSLIPRSLQSQ